MNVDDSARPDEPTIPEMQDQQSPPAEQPQQPAEPAIEEEDVDAIEMREALAAAEAEKATAGQGADDQGDEPPSPETRQEQRPETPMIPKPRFDEVNGQLAAMQRQIALLEGKLAASSIQQPPAGQEPAAAPANPLDAVRSQMLDIARQFDEGELSMAEYKEREWALQQQRDDLLLAQARPQQQGSTLADRDFLDRQAAALAQQHPYVDRMSDDQFQRLVGYAKTDLGAEWAAKPEGAQKQLELMQKVAVMSDEFGPTWVKQSNGSGQSQMSMTAQQRAAKIAMSGEMPPNLSQMTGASPGTGPSAADIENMSDEDISALPAAVRQRAMEFRA